MNGLSEALYKAFEAVLCTPNLASFLVRPNAEFHKNRKLTANVVGLWAICLAAVFGYLTSGEWLVSLGAMLAKISGDNIVERVQDNGKRKEEGNGGPGKESN